MAKKEGGGAFAVAQQIGKSLLPQKIFWLVSEGH